MIIYIFSSLEKKKKKKKKKKKNTRLQIHRVILFKHINNRRKKETNKDVFSNGE